MADDGFALHNLLQNRSDVRKAGRVLKIDWFDSSDPFSVVEDFVGLIMVVARLNQRVKDNIAIKVDNAHSSKSLTIFG